MNVFILSGVIVTVVAIALAFVARYDKPVPVGKDLFLWISVAGTVEGAFLSDLFVGYRFREQMMMGIFAGCLLFACVTDSLMCQVHNFVWWAGLAVGIGLLVSCFGKQEAELGYIGQVDAIVQLLIFVILQFLVFVRTYGRADGYAFCACAVAETALGLKMECYLLHMILAYLSLIAVQGTKGNISRRGCLKHPVPFLPYINIAFWMTLAACL